MAHSATVLLGGRRSVGECAGDRLGGAARGAAARGHAMAPAGHRGLLDMSARRTSRSRVTRLRAIGWLVVTGMLAAAMLPGASLAVEELNRVSASDECPAGTAGFKIDDTN